MSSLTPRPISLGYSHFHELRQRGNLLVDKSRFILHVLESPYTGMLIPRPRRFGKTLNMSMLKDFLGRSHIDMTPYFQDLQIWQVPQARAHFQQYPVIFVSFKDCKGQSWPVCWQLIREALFFMLRDHLELLSAHDRLDQETIQWFDAALTKRFEPEGYTSALKRLSQALASLHGAPVVILIDEYDTPIHNALEHGFYDDAISFFKGFLGAGFKDNPHLFRGVMTGILRVSKENMFSDLNNVGVYSLLHEHFKADFGFTEQDVRAVLDEHACTHLMPALERAYNGYLFGSDAPVAIYNPWSTLSCIANPHHKLIPYWHKSGSPELLHRLVLQQGPHIHDALKTLISGQTLSKQVSEHINLTRLSHDDAELFGFMLFAGYLKALKAETDGLRWNVSLTLVNDELRTIFDELYQGWLQDTLGSRGTELLVQAVLEGDVASFQAQLEQILLRYTSFMDGAASTPEHFYHGLMLGLMVLLKEHYTVLSNLETGRGRADLLLLPHQPQHPGVVMELKVVRSKGDNSMLEGLCDALQQLQSRKYATLLESQQLSTIHCYGLAFNGKEVRVAELSQLPELARLRARNVAELNRSLQGAGAAYSGSAGPSPLTLEERLELEDLVLPHLTGSELERMWGRLGFSLAELPQKDLELQWLELVSRCTQAGQLSELATLIGRQLPVLKEEPLVQKLRGG